MIHLQPAAGGTETATIYNQALLLIAFTGVEPSLYTVRAVTSVSTIKVFGPNKTLEDYGCTITYSGTRAIAYVTLTRSVAEYTPQATIIRIGGNSLVQS